MAQESRLIISVDARNAQTTAEKLTKELDNITNSGNKADKQVGILGNSLRTLAGYMAGVVTVSAAINKIDAYTNLQNRLKLVTNSQQELNQATQDTFKIAQNARQEWDSVVQVYQRFSDNAKTLGINMEQTARLTDTVSKAVAISGASAASAEAALTQFGQALGTGTLRGEELNSVMEQTPALAKAIAQGMGITIGQLRAVAAEGKITSDVLVKALTKVADDVDSQFSRTDATIAQSFTQLSNATTQFVGEAGQASGAAQLLSGSISTLAQNLDLVANVAILGGVAALTKAIVTQTTAVYGSVTASVAQRAATAAQNQASIAAAVAATNEAKAHLANVLATNAEAQAKYGATAAAARYKLASDAVTQALIAQTAAQAAANTTASIGARALALVGGPIGAITIGVTALSAGYMYLQSRTEEANRKLEEQASIATKTKDELLALEGAQKSSARTDLAAAFKAQNDELERSDQIIGNLIAQIYSKNTADAETAKILKEVREGTMTYDDAFKELNTSKANMPDIINRLRDEINNYEEARQKAQQNADAQQTLGVKVELAGNAAQNAVGKINSNSGALDSNASSALGAANAQNEYFKSLRQTAIQTATTNKLIEKGFDPEKAKAYAEAVLKNGGKLSKEEAQLINFNLAENEKLKNSVDAIAKSHQANAKASKSAASQQKKDASESNRRAEESLQLREQYIYAYADREKQIELSLSKEIEDIRKAGFDNPEIYIDAAKKRAYLEKQIYLSQLQFEINEFKMSEEQKLKYSFEIKQLQLQQNTEITDKTREIALKALDEQYNQELALSQLAKEKRIFDAEQGMYSEMEIIRKRYDFERQEIAKTAGLSDEERQRRLDASNFNQQQEENSTQFDLQKNYNQALGMDTSVDEAFKTRQEAIDAAYQNGLIKQEEFQQQSLASQRAYEVAKTGINVEYGEDIVGSLADMYGSMRGEQSKGFKVLFAAEKAFAIARASIALGENIARASSIGFPQNLPLIAGAVAQGATIFSIIRSVKDAGFQTGGYTGNGGVSDVAGVVHGQEYVLNAAATKRVGVGTLDAINSGANLTTGSNVNITINTPAGYTAQQTQTSDGITIDIVRKEAQDAVTTAFQNLNNANSTESRQITRNFNTTRAR